MKTKSVSSLKDRRAFLKMGVTSTLASTAAFSEASPCAAPAAMKWDETHEIIIVGSGLAATVAGLSALRAGTRPIMLEKMAVAGGSSAISNGTLTVPDSPLQREQGIKDSWESFYDDMIRTGEGYNQAALVKAFAQNARAGFDFLVENGAFFEDYVMAFPGHSVKRVIQPVKSCANGILWPIRASYLKKHPAGLRTRCRVDEILFDSNGRAMGVKVRENYHFDPKLKSDDIENRSGDVRYYRATKGIICASGSYVSDVQFRIQEFPQLESVYTTQQVGATASGFRLLANAGSRMVQTSIFRPAFPQAFDMMLGMMIDPKTGKRFIQENLNRTEMFFKTSSLLDHNGRKIPLSIFDSRMYPLVGDKKHLDVNLNAGYASKHESIEAIARYYDIPLEPLKASIKQYNGYAKSGKDPEFNRNFEMNKGLGIVEPPFYVIEVRPDFNYIMGGALINEHGQVIGLNTNAPIDGLYAAGEATGGLHGMQRLNGNSMLDCTVFGMITGAHCAKA